MLKILLVDSDKDNLKNFRNFLKVTYPEIKNVKALSSNKVDIYDYLKEENPNLIVGDIRFFGINAYQIIRNIYDMFPEVRLILYGTYNDSEYLKRSLDFGVINYMFKPVKPAEFKKAMENAITIFEELSIKKKEEVILMNEYLEDIKIFEDKFLQNVLLGYVKNDMELFRSFKYFDFDFFDNYCVCILRIDHFKKIILTLDELEKHMLVTKVLNLVNKNLDNKVSKATITNFNMISIIISGKITLEDVMNISQKIRNNIFDAMQIRVTIGVGRIYQKPSNINYSYREAEAALRYRFYLGYNSIIPISFVEPDNFITYRYPLEKENRLVYAAVIGEYEYCKMLLEELFEALKEAGDIPANLVPQIILNILISISRYALEQNVLGDFQFSSFFSFKEGLEVRTVEEGHDYLDKAIKGFCEHVISVHEKDDKELFKKVKTYATDNYYENITIYEMAVKFNTTPDYLNNLFVKEEGKTFSEFIMLRRIEIGKQLMKETDNDDDMISVQLGFDNAKLFRSIFKQYENIFPYEYRNRYGGK